MKLDGPSNYGVGDIIVLNTIRGQRSISLTKSYQLLSAPTDFMPPNGYNIGDSVFYGPGIWEAKIDLAGGTTWDMAPEEDSKYWTYLSAPIVSHLSSDSQWLELHSSSNTMSIYKGNNPSSYVATIKYLKYTSAYWGI